MNEGNTYCGTIMKSQIVVTEMPPESEQEELERLRKESLDNIQEEQNEWARRNFGQSETWKPLLGAMEELGELAHAHLKESQGIRVNENHEENAKDAVADTILYLMDYCSLRDWSLQDILVTTWQEVKERDWSANPVSGKSDNNKETE